MFSGKKAFIMLFIVLLFFGFITRSYKLNNSIAEHNAYEQSLIVAGIKHASGYDLEKKAVIVPLYTPLITVLTKNIPSLPVETAARSVMGMASLIAMVCFFSMLTKQTGKTGAFFGCLFFAVMPYVVFYSRSVLPEVLAVSLIMIAVACAYAVRAHWIWSILAIIFAVAAIIISPFVWVYGVVIGYGFFSTNHIKSILTKILMVIAFFACMGAAVFYTRSFTMLLPFKAVVTWSAALPLLEQFLMAMLGGVLIFFILNALYFPEKKLRFQTMFLVASALFITLYFKNLSQHNYLFFILIPAVVVYIAHGVANVIEDKLTPGSLARIVGTVFLFTIAFVISYGVVRSYYLPDTNKIKIAQAIQAFSNDNDIILADQGGNSTVLYLADRIGYSNVQKPIDQYKASFFITENAAKAATLKDTYSLVYESDNVFIFKL